MTGAQAPERAKMKTVNVGGTDINVPDMYVEVQTMPEDPPGTVAMMMETDRCMSLMMLFPVPSDSYMLTDEPEDIIDGIHRELAENQGLIEIGEGESRIHHWWGRYSIVKTLRHDSGMQYVLVMDVRTSDEYAFRLRAFFDEAGITGERDAIVYEMLRRDEKVGNEEDPFAGWTEDPYDPDFTYGALMNRSEEPQFDSLFPEHPLSTARRTIGFLLENN